MITTTDLPDHYLIQSDRRPHLYLLVDKDEWEEWEEKLRGGERVSNDRRIAEANIRAENMRAALGEPATGGVVQRSEPWYEHGFRAGDPYPTAQQLNDLLAAAREEGRQQALAEANAELQRLRSHVQMLEGDKASMGKVYGEALITRQRYAELERVAREWRQWYFGAVRVVSPETHRLTPKMLLELAAAIDALPVEEGSDGR